jgi:hypothetical protein
VVEVPVEVPYEVPVYIEKPVMDEEVYLRMGDLEREIEMLRSENS